jgi:hypothetical protein
MTSRLMRAPNPIGCVGSRRLRAELQHGPGARLSRVAYRLVDHGSGPRRAMVIMIEGSAPGSQKLRTRVLDPFPD